MEIKKISEVAYNYLKEVNEATFKELWKEVVANMKMQWKEEFSGVLLKDIMELKIGEFYTILTIDGRFIKNQKDVWLLAETLKLNEARNLKEYIGEILEDE